MSAGFWTSDQTLKPGLRHGHSSPWIIVGAANAVRPSARANKSPLSRAPRRPGGPSTARSFPQGSPPFHVRAHARSGSPTSVRTRSPGSNGGTRGLPVPCRLGHVPGHQAREPRKQGHGGHYEQERCHRPSPPFTGSTVGGRPHGAPARRLQTAAPPVRRRGSPMTPMLQPRAGTDEQEQVICVSHANNRLSPRRGCAMTGSLTRDGLGRPPPLFEPVIERLHRSSAPLL